jgi:hypothetical protein
MADEAGVDALRVNSLSIGGATRDAAFFRGRRKTTVCQEDEPD